MRKSKQHFRLVRNLDICPKCEQESLVRVDTEARKRPASRGAVLRERLFECRTPDCGERVESIEISKGHSGRSYLRVRGEARGTKGYTLDDRVLVEDLTHGLAVVRL